MCQMQQVIVWYKATVNYDYLMTSKTSLINYFFIFIFY